MKALSSQSGVTLVELLAVVAAIGILSTLGYVSVTGVRTGAEENKLESDVGSVNRSVGVYLASGGNLDNVANADDVLAKLKTRADADSAARTIGLKSGFMDARVIAVWQTEEEAGTSQARAVWDGAQMRFNVVRGGTRGIKEFRFDEAAALVTGTEARSPTKAAATESAWVWDYTMPTASTSRAGAFPMPGTLPTTLTDIINQGFSGGFWTVSEADGRVDVDYVFREAGYNSRLALVSLEGMGPEHYDLSTTEGRIAFMTELVRRVVDSDRAQVIIDATEVPGGNGVKDFEQDYYFRPGDTVAAVLIPNASFDTSYANLLSGTTGGTSFPLTSLHMGTDEDPFHPGQIASLGNNGYAIEDIPGGGDADYDDLIFTARGLSQSEGSTFREIDPTTYYPQRLAQLGRNYWTNPFNGGPSLQQALIDAGIIGQ
jgi:prepilin-type N-terminal cleavage/methylation domain-containing protein